MFGRERGFGVLRMASVSILHVWMGFLCLVAVSKLADLAPFQASLATWRVIPEWSHTIISMAVPLVELACGLAWFLGLARGRVVWMSVIGLGVVTMAYAAQVWFAEPPKCDCLGILLRFERWEQGAWAVVERNVALLIVAGEAAAAWTRVTTRRTSSSEEQIEGP